MGETKSIRWIAVVGGSGSGKSWLAADLLSRLGDQVAHICLDNFYQDLRHLSVAARLEVNFDDPAAIDWEHLFKIMVALEKEGRAQLPIYDFSEHITRPETTYLESHPIIILEGLWLLTMPWLREKISLSIFVECAEEMRLARRIARDVMTRDRTAESVISQFSQHVQPMHALYVEPQREFADICVSSPLSEMEMRVITSQCLGNGAVNLL